MPSSQLGTAGANHPATKRITIKQSGSGVFKVGCAGNGKSGFMSVTPRLVNNNECAQKSTPNLNLRMKPQIHQPQAAVVRKGGSGITAVGIHNVSPAGKAA